MIVQTMHVPDKGEIAVQIQISNEADAIHVRAAGFKECRRLCQIGSIKEAFDLGAWIQQGIADVALVIARWPGRQRHSGK
ncbi:MAG: hypothetical protein R3C12_21605 [Planctomycetaceae bacterium]